MTDINTLINRIDQEIEAEVKREKVDWAKVMLANRDRELRLQRYEAEAKRTTWCPDRDYYDCGVCSNPVRRDSNTPCPFDGKILPLREVVIESADDQPESCSTVVYAKHRRASLGARRWSRRSRIGS
jgi:hypothetical protein